MNLPRRTAANVLLLAGCALMGVPSSAAESPETDDAERHQVLPDPTHEQNRQTCPDQFQAKFHTSAGDFVIEVHRAWAPLGADRFYNLVANGYFDGCRFFRVVPGFVVQWGIHGDPEISAAWDQRRNPDAAIEDDPVVESNTRGRVTFATAGPRTRTTQLFINFGDNSALDDPEAVGSKFAPFGEVIEGMDAVDAIYAGYGQSPNQGRIQHSGNGYLEERFPKLDHIITATIVEPEEDGSEGKQEQAAQTQPAE